MKDKIVKERDGQKKTFRSCSASLAVCGFPYRTRFGAPQNEEKHSKGKILFVLIAHKTENNSRVLQLRHRISTSLSLSLSVFSVAWLIAAVNTQALPFRSGAQSVHAQRTVFPTVFLLLCENSSSLLGFSTIQVNQKIHFPSFLPVKMHFTVRAL